MRPDMRPRALACTRTLPMRKRASATVERGSARRVRRGIAAVYAPRTDTGGNEDETRRARRLWRAARKLVGRRADCRGEDDRRTAGNEAGTDSHPGLAVSD